MRIKITFEGDSNEDRDEINDLLTIPSYKRAVTDFDQWLRQNIKHGDKEEISFEDVQEKLWEFLYNSL